MDGFSIYEVTWVGLSQLFVVYLSAKLKQHAQDHTAITCDPSQIEHFDSKERKKEIKYHCQFYHWITPI